MLKEMSTEKRNAKKNGYIKRRRMKHEGKEDEENAYSKDVERKKDEESKKRNTRKGKQHKDSNERKAIKGKQDEE